MTNWACSSGVMRPGRDRAGEQRVLLGEDLAGPVQRRLVAGVLRDLGVVEGGEGALEGADVVQQRGVVGERAGAVGAEGVDGAAPVVQPVQFFDDLVGEPAGVLRRRVAGAVVGGEPAEQVGLPVGDQAAGLHGGAIALHPAAEVDHRQAALGLQRAAEGAGRIAVVVLDGLDTPQVEPLAERDARGERPQDAEGDHRDGDHEDDFEADGPKSRGLGSPPVAGG
ncbi:hypothetical protein LUX39_40270 [Actinomadura madurae]|nr:hypothetical protein [Actinomadura madurae]MCQ0019255.1 hypothetical protein [Actinomadura madurae]